MKETEETEQTEETAAAQKPALLSKNALVGTVVLLAILYFTSYITRKSFGAIKLGLPEGLMNDRQIGLVGSALFFFYGAGQIVSGILGDRIDPRKLIFSGLFATLTCNALFPLIQSVPVLIGLWAINGFAQAMFWPPLVKLLTIYVGSGERYTKSVMWVSMTCQIAILAVYIFATLWIRLNLWWGIFAGASALALLVGIFLFFGFRKLEKAYPGRVRDALLAKRREKSAAAAKSTASAAKTPLWRVILTTGLLAVFVMTATIGFLRDGMEEWLSTYFHDVFGIAADMSTLMNVVMPIFGVVCVRLTAILFLRVFKRNEMAQTLALISLLAGAGVLLALTSGKSVPLSLCLAVLMVGASHAVNTTLTSYLPARYVSLGCVSTVSGLVNAFTYVGSTVSTSLIPVMVEKTSWRITIFSWAAVAAICLAAVLTIYRKWKRFIQQQN